MKGKQILIGIAIVAVIAVAYIAFDNSGSDEYARGTIGAADTVIAGVEPADRHRSEQITPDDVQLGDTELQRFLQSEIVEELIQNPSFARAIQEQAVKAAMEEGWTEAIFESEETREALAAIPLDDGGSLEIPLDDPRGEIPIDDPSGEIPIDDEASFEEILSDEFVRAALADDMVRNALLDEYLREALAEEWLQAALDDAEVQAWLKEAAERGLEDFKTAGDREEFKAAGDREEFKSEDSRDEFKAAGDRDEFKAAGDRDEFKAVGPDLDEFKATSDDAEQFKAALEANPALRKAVFEHAAVFQKAAFDSDFRRALQRSVDDFARMEAAFGKAVIGNRTLAFALAEDADGFFRAVQLARIPELQKMDAGMRRALLTNKTVQDAVLARAVEFHKAEEGF